MSIFLAVVSLPIALIGLLFASQATIGVAIVGFACLLGIYARIAQAHAHHAPVVAPVESTPMPTRDRLMFVVVMLCLFGGFAGAFLAQR